MIFEIIFITIVIIVIFVIIIDNTIQGKKLFCAIVSLEVKAFE